MSFERPSSPVPGEPGPPLVPEAQPADVTAPAMRLQILSTEHWSLLATRSLVWNEVFGRAGMYLSTLSGAIVALALVAQGTRFGETFKLFALVILPVVLFLGWTTFVRLGASNYHDAQCVIGMNRIRGAYLQLAPELRRYFVMSPHDDARGVGITMAFPPGHRPFVHMLAATPTVVSVINSVIVGALVAIVAIHFAIGDALAVGLAVIGFALAFAAHALWGRAAISRAQARVQPIFPSPREG